MTGVFISIGLWALTIVVAALVAAIAWEDKQ